MQNFASRPRRLAADNSRLKLPAACTAASLAALLALAFAGCSDDSSDDTCASCGPSNGTGGSAGADSGSGGDTTKFAGQKVSTDQLQAELDMESLDIELPGLAAGQDFKAVLEAAKRHLQLHKNFSLDNTLSQWERGYVEAALMITQGNLTQAAKMLGIHRTTLYSRMQGYGGHAGNNGGGEAAKSPRPAASK